MQDPPDGRGRRGRHALAPEVPGDRDGTGVETAPGELRAQRDDPRAHDVGHPPRAGVRPARSRLEGVNAAIPVPAEQALEVLPADPVLGRRGGDGQLLGDDLEDGHPMLRHGRDCRACPDSPVTDHVSPMSWTQTPLGRANVPFSCSIGLGSRLETGTGTAIRQDGPPPPHQGCPGALREPKHVVSMF